MLHGSGFSQTFADLLVGGGMDGKVDLMVMASDMNLFGILFNTKAGLNGESSDYIGHDKDFDDQSMNEFLINLNVIKKNKQTWCRY